MPAQIATTDDLRELKNELLEAFKKLLETQNSQSSKKWLRSPEVRNLLGISHATLQTFRINGTLPYTRMGGILYYDADDINKILVDKKFQNRL